MKYIPFAWIAALLTIGVTFAADPTPPPADDQSPRFRKPSDREGPPDRRPQQDRSIPEPIQKKLDSLPPDQKRRFLQNWQKWRSLDEKQRHEIRNRIVEDRFKNASFDDTKPVEKLIEEAGLELDRDQQELFALRLRQERRKAEEEIREAVKKLRDEMDQEILVQLKEEFSPKSESPDEPAEE